MSFQDVLTSSTLDGRVQSRQLSNGYVALDKRLLGPVSGCIQLLSLRLVNSYSHTVPKDLSYLSQIQCFAI